MLLAIDIGNTNITLGVFTNVGLAAKWRIATDEGKQSDETMFLVIGIGQDMTCISEIFQTRDVIFSLYCP